MQVELTSEDVLQLVSSLHESEQLARRNSLNTGDKVVRRNARLKQERIMRLRQRLFRVVEGNLNT